MADMALQAIASQVRETTLRARSLFSGASGEGPRPAASTQAAAANTAAAATMAAESGVAAGRYTRLVADLGRQLATADRADLLLDDHLTQAGRTTAKGHQRLDDLVTQAQAVTNLATRADTPGSQRAVLEALRAITGRTGDVVLSTRHEADRLAAGIRILDWGAPTAPALPPPPPPPHEGPDSILIWCVPDPMGGFSCIEHYPDGSWWQYPSPVDESGVKNHWPY